MKKSLVTLLACATAVASVCAFTSCGTTELKDQPNNMTILSVSQDADGSIYANVDLSTTVFSQKSGEVGNYYNIQPSLDGGKTWANFAVIQIVDASIDKIPIAVYSQDKNSFVLGSNEYNDAGVVDLTAGDELQITLRFMGNESFKASAPTNTVNYTFKWVSAAGTGLPSVAPESIRYEYTAMGGIQNDYAFEAQPDNSFKLRREIYSDDGDDFIILADLTAEELGMFEYKFYMPTAEESGNFTYSALRGAEENERLLSGWTDYADVIPYAECMQHQVTEYSKWSTYDENNNVVGEKEMQRSVAVLLLRYKETSTSVRSKVVPVHLVLSDWVDVA